MPSKKGKKRRRIKATRIARDRAKKSRRTLKKQEKNFALLKIKKA